MGCSRLGFHSFLHKKRSCSPLNPLNPCRFSGFYSVAFLEYLPEKLPKYYAQFFCLSTFRPAPFQTAFSPIFSFILHFFQAAFFGFLFIFYLSFPNSMIFFSQALSFLCGNLFFFAIIRELCICLYLFLNNPALYFSNTAYFPVILRYNIGYKPRISAPACPEARSTGQSAAQNMQH